jgi:hypothetical protein
MSSVSREQTKMSNILMTGAGIVRAELPHLEATVNDIRQHPSNAAFDILEFLKGLWTNITTSGILPVSTKRLCAGLQPSLGASVCKFGTKKQPRLFLCFSE